jgi:endosialidase-like protein
MTHRGNLSSLGFMLAPLLYMLALAGIGAAVLYSSYSQILRSNAQMTAINAVRSQLQSAGTTLAASSVLDSATSTVVQPPAVYAFGSIAGGDTAKLPSNYTNASSTGTPHDVGVVDTATGVRQLDPWGKFYVYCRWENPVSSPSSPSIVVISAGPDGNLDTKCGDTIAQGDDKFITSTVAETINRANVWQVNSSSQIKYGLAANPVEVNANGAMQAAMLTLGSAPAASTSGQLSAISANISGALTAGSTTFSGATITGNATIGGTLGVTGAATFSGTLAAGATSLSSLTLTTPLAVAQGGTGATTAAAARTNLGSTAVGDAVFTAASAGAARTTLGSTTVGDALFIAASAGAARATLGSTTVGDALFIAADAASGRSTLGLGTMATQNANAVAITGGTITGVTFTGNITGNASGSAGSVAASGVTGCCVAISAGGTGAGDAATARSNLGTNNASNLTTGTVSVTLLPTSGVIAGTYTQVTVDAYGRVTVGANVNSSQWTNSGSNIYFNTGNVSIGTTVANTELNVYNASSATLTDFTQALTKGAINVLTNYTANNYTPGVFWSATDDNATKPKAGIWLKEAAAGTTMYLGTSNAYATGITNQALSIDQNGVVTASGGFVGNITGNVTGNVSGQISLSDGSAASPGLYFTNDTNTGIYRPGADVLGIAAGGNDVARFVGNTSGVNYFNLSAATTGNAVTISAAGTDTNIGIALTPKGTGNLNLSTGAYQLNGNNAVAEQDSTHTTVVGATAAAADTTASAGTTAMGYQALNSLTVGSGNSAFGYQAAAGVTTTNNNTAMGFQAMVGATGANNTAMGWQALFWDTGGQNTGLGAGALFNNRAGNNNTAVGWWTMVFNQGGSNNTSMGYTALYNSTSSNNAAFGYNALNTQTSGANNTALGYQAGYDVTIGGNNVIIGYYPTTAVGITTGSNNILIGYDLQELTKTSSNQLDIGNLIFATSLASGTTLSAGSVGVGVISPNHTLDVNGNIGLVAGGYLNFGSTDGTTGYGMRDSAGTIQLKNSGGTWAAPLTASSTITANNFAAGSVGAPGLYVVGNATTGLYQATANTLSVTAGGVEAGRFLTTANGVDYLTFAPGASGSPGTVTIGAAGSDTDIKIALTPKGTGNVSISGSAANQLSVTTTSTAGATAAVFGNASGSTGAIYGGIFQTASSLGIGVYGYGSSTSGSNYGGYFQSASSGGVSLYAIAGNAATKGLVVAGAASQTGDLTEWQNSSSTVLAKVDSAGNISTTGTMSATGGITGTVTGHSSLDLAIANNLSDLNSASTARTNLGLGSIATQAASLVNITGGTMNGVTIGGTAISSGAFTTVSATSTVTGSALNVTQTTAATNGLYLPAGNTVAISANSLDVMRFNAATNAVNYLLLNATATGNPITLSAAGSDTDVGITITPKGAGGITTSGSAAVQFSSTTSGAEAVYARSTLASGTSYGLLAQSDSTSGKAVVGQEVAATGTTYGGYFSSQSTSGISLYALASNAATKALVVQGAVSQTGDLTEWQNSSGTVLAKVDSSGNVTTPLLIGGTAASSTLTLESTSGAGTSDAIIFKTASQAEAMRINTSGQVGIGTTAPIGSLNVNISSGNNGIYVTNASNTSSDYAVLDFKQAGVNEGALYTHSSNLYLEPYNGNLILNQYGGNVGIGTTAPWETFQVRTATDKNVGFRSSIAGMVTMDMVNDANSANVGLEVRGSPVVFTTGNVGIGTASPGYNLDVGGAGATGSISRLGGMSILTADSGYEWWTGSFTATGPWQLTHRKISDSTWTNAITVDTSNNVGIGVTSPGAKLDVKGTLRLEGSTSGYSALVSPATAGSVTWTLPGADGSNGQALTTNGAGTLSWASPTASASGASGYVQFSNGTNLASDSNFFWDNTNKRLGIGTVTPNASLNAVGATAQLRTDTNTTTGFGGLTGTNTVANFFDIGILGSAATGTNAGLSKNNMVLFDAGGSVMLLDMLSAAPIVFATNATERARIDSSGNVGIGTASPGALLHVSGGSYNTSLKADGSSTSGIGLDLKNTGTGGKEWTIISNGSANSGGAGPLQFYDVTDNITPMILLPSGNVGIGTTSPIVDANSATATYLSVANGTAHSWGEISVGGNATATSDIIGALQFYNSSLGTNEKRNAVIVSTNDGATNSGNLLFYTANAGTVSERMRIDHSGNVGIGLTAPGAPLEVRGTSAGYASNAGNLALTTAGSTNGLRFGVYDSNYSWISSFNSLPLILNAGGNNVGIGTTSPFSKTTISKAVVNSISTADASNNSHLTLAGSDALVRLQMGVGGASMGPYGGWIQASYDNGGGNNGIEPLLLNPSGGNVGIGVMAPGAKLQINSEIAHTYPTPGTVKGSVHINPAGTNGNSASLTFGANNSGSLLDIAYAGIYVQSSSAYGSKMYFGTTDDYGVGSKARMMIDQSGNVGIGTTSPVSGYVAGAKTLQIGDGSNAWAAFKMVEDQGTIEIAADTDRWYFHDGNEAAGSMNAILTIDNATKRVGIGTTSPTNKLDIYSNSTGKDILIGAWDANTNWNQINLNGLTGVGNYNFLSGNGDQTLYINRPSGGPMYFRENNVTQMMIASGGNVGIGTTAPDSNLEVSSGGATNVSINGGNANATLKFENSGTMEWQMYNDTATGNSIRITNGTNGAKLNQGDTLWSSVSDARLKTDVQPLPVLDRLGNFRAVSFHWKGTEMPAATQLGVIAQEVYPLFPEVVTKGSDNPNEAVTPLSPGAWTVKYELLGPLALEGVKELKHLLDGVIEDVKKLAARVDEAFVKLAAHDDEIKKLKDENKELRDAVCKLDATASFCRPLKTGKTGHPAGAPPHADNDNLFHDEFRLAAS